MTKQIIVNINKKTRVKFAMIFFSLKIRNLASMVENKTFLEIGTWNGLGSTNYLQCRIYK